MLFCHNRTCNTIFNYIVNNSEEFYRRIEFAICPICKKFKYRDYRQFHDGSEIVKDLTLGEEEFNKKINKWRSRANNIKQGTKTNQSFYYGSCTRKKTKDGSIIDIQLRKNFNNKVEILGESKIKKYMV